MWSTETNAYTRVPVSRIVIALMSSAGTLPRGSEIVGTLLTLTTLKFAAPSVGPSATCASHVTIGSSGGGGVSPCDGCMPSSTLVPTSVTPTARRRDMRLLVFSRLLRREAGDGLVEVLGVR